MQIMECASCKRQGKINRCYITGYNSKCGHDNGLAYAFDFAYWPCLQCKENGLVNNCFVTGYDTKCGHDCGWAYPYHHQSLAKAGEQRQKYENKINNLEAEVSQLKSIIKMQQDQSPVQMVNKFCLSFTQQLNKYQLEIDHNTSQLKTKAVEQVKIGCISVAKRCITCMIDKLVGLIENLASKNSSRATGMASIQQLLEKHSFDKSTIDKVAQVLTGSIKQHDVTKLLEWLDSARGNFAKN